MSMIKKIKIISAFILLALPGCFDVPEEIIIPEWEVDLNIPLANKLLTVDSLIGQQQHVSIDPLDSLYILRSKEYTQTQGLLEFIKMNEPVSEQNLALNPVNESRDVFFEFRSDVVELDSAEFANGLININVRNRSSLRVNFRVTLPGVSQAGTVFVLNIPLGPSESTVITRDLTGYIYAEPVNQPPILQNRFWIQAESQAAGVNTGGDVEFDVEISAFSFRYLAGRFIQQDLPRRTDTINADLGEELEGYRNKVTISSASLILSAQYSSFYENPFSVRVDSLTIAARTGNEIIYLRDSTGSIYFNIIVNRGRVNVSFNESNSNVTELINAFPDYFEISSSVSLLGNNQSGIITNEDIASVSLDISTRSHFALGRANRVDTSRIVLDEESRNDIRSAQFTSAFAILENAVPLRVWIRVDLLDINFNRLFTVRLDNMDSVFAEGAAVNTSTGDVISPVSSTYSVELTDEQINQLADSYYAVTSVTLETSGFRDPDPPLVKLRATDWFRFRVYGMVKYRVEGL